jgi:hypothetical protein
MRYACMKLKMHGYNRTRWSLGCCVIWEQVRTLSYELELVHACINALTDPNSRIESIHRSIGCDPGHSPDNRDIPCLGSPLICTWTYAMIASTCPWSHGVQTVAALPVSERSILNLVGSGYFMLPFSVLRYMFFASVKSDPVGSWKPN